VSHEAGEGRGGPGRPRPARPRLFGQAVAVGSAATDILAETAGRLGIWLSVGVDERDGKDSTVYNRPDIFRLSVDTSPRPVVTELNR
jgi:hypothetical protein